MVASNGRHLSAVAEQLRAGASVSVASPDGETAMSLALTNGHSDVAAVLAESG